MTTMQGRRLQPNADGEYPWATIRPGDFFCYKGHWYGQTPNGLLAGLAKHQVTEHPDGTITVCPSILVHRSNGEPPWHGYLENGVWREV